MRTDDFNFDLPESLIAQYPPSTRGESRLFVLDRARGTNIHTRVDRLHEYLESGSLMVFNDSKVRKARIYAVADDTKARVEFLLLSPVSADNEGSGSIGAWPRWKALCSKAKRQRKGRSYSFPEGLAASIVDEYEEEKIVEFSRPVGDAYLELHGHMPLPPYIKRPEDKSDESRYQTVYARSPGSVACPTAGLHFTPAILERLRDAGIETAWVTLHVGLGTFLPVRSETVEEHRMHEEWYSVPESTASAIRRAKSEGRKIVAVGTTALRTLESAAAVSGGGFIASGSGKTSIFIYPGYEFKVVDRLFTNFHTPKSTLLMLVAAFAGRENILAAYEEAIRLGYKFFSYGDAMLIR
ncbi:MAG TPA: tRNA preQ1(34) S-adenosylmethionine ribosyltransferase-isomerase QueA [Rectinemataceae bacterium]